MPTLEELERALGAEHAEERRQAVIAIGEYPDKGAGPLLLRALGDAEWRVREEAVRVGADVAERWELIGELVAAVGQGENVGLRNAALDLLGQLGEAAVGALVASLGTVAETARKFVIEALAHSGVPSVVDTLVAELDGAGPNEIASAIDALGAIGGEAAERALLAQLASGESYVRMAAIDALNRLGAVVPWDSLDPLLDDRLVFRVALEAMGRCDDARALSPLMRALEDRSPRVVATAASALGRLAASPLRAEVQRVLEVAAGAQRTRLAELSQRSGSDAGRAAVELLTLARDPAALRPMLELAQQRALGRGVVSAMCAWGWDAVDRLLEIYRDERARRGAAALEVAGELARSLPDRDAVLVGGLREALRRELQGIEPDLLAAAVRGMGSWAEASDARRLVALASSEHEDVREGSRLALESLAERELAAVADALVGVNPDGTGGAQLAGLIARVSEADAPARLHAALLASEPETRCAAIRGLAAHGGPKSAELLALSLTDESADVQVAAADALGQVLAREHAPDGASALSAALDAEGAAVQAAAARALAAAGVADASPALVRVAREGAAAARVAAIEALCALVPDDLASVLERALTDEEPDVVKQALRGLNAQAAAGAPRALREALEHAAWDVRATAAELLGEQADAASRDALRARLDREADRFVREAIGRALGEGEV